MNMKMEVSEAEFETIKAQAARVPDLADKVESQGNQIEELESENSELKEENTELRDRLDKAEHSAEYAHERVEELEEENRTQHKTIFRKLEGGSGHENPTLETGEPASTDSLSMKSPLEQITNLPEHIAEDSLTENQQRMRFIAKDVLEYADKTPKGYVVDSSEVSTALTVRDGKSPHSQTVKRVMLFLDSFGKEEVETKIHKGRRIAVFDETAARRYGNGPTPEAQCGVIVERAKA